MHMNRLRPWLLSLVCLLGSSGVLGASLRDKLSAYVYQDIRQLVRLVEEAAALIESSGTATLPTFGTKNSKWFNEENYLFVYDEQGINVFHPVEPHLQGQDLSALKDMEGKPVVASLMAIARKPEPDASGWIFYLWEEPGHMLPVWKGSYVRKAVAPDGEVYLVGSGLYNIKIEKTFIQASVDQAAVLILQLGKEAAFEQLRRIACPLHVMDSYIHVTDEEGNVLVDPLFPNLPHKRNIAKQLDLIGKNVFQETRAVLGDKESTWSSFTAAKPGSGLPEKNLIYTRKIRAGDEIFYVGAGYVPASPIWLK